MKFQIQKYLQVDDVKIESYPKMTLPSEKISERGAAMTRYHGASSYSSGVYFGFSDYVFYSLLWSDFCHTHDYTVQNVSFENEEGADLGLKNLSIWDKTVLIQKQVITNRHLQKI